MKKYGITLLVSFILINGCSKEQEDTISVESKQGKIFNAQVQALEKAKGVEQMLQNGADKQRQNIDAQTR